MSIDQHTLIVAGLHVQVVRKEIKNLHLGVYPPNGRVRIAAPLALTDEAVRLAVVEKIGWIKRQQAKFASQPRQSEREMVNGESHYFQGRRFRLLVVEDDAKVGVIIPKNRVIELHVKPGASAEKRRLVLQAWYRQQLRQIVPPLFEKWQGVLGTDAQAWSIRRMKTRWGACNHRTRHIWLNLELAKKPVKCLEYLIVHELVHLFAPLHDDLFVSLMDHHLPTWKQSRQELNSEPLSHDTWSY